MKRPLDVGMANVQVESVNQAIAQHQAVIQMQSDAAQVLATVAGLVAALGGGYPAEQVQAVASQVETLRAIQATSTQALHTSCATLQNLLSHASTQASQTQALPWASAPVLHLPGAAPPQQMQPQMFAPPQQMQSQQMPLPGSYGSSPYGSPPPMLYGGPDAGFGPGATTSPMPFVDPRAGEKRKTSICKNFETGLRTSMSQWLPCAQSQQPLRPPTAPEAGLACLHMPRPRPTHWAQQGSLRRLDAAQRPWQRSGACPKSPISSR